MAPNGRQTRQEAPGVWGTNLFFGGQFIRRSYYETRAAARQGDVADSVGERGCIALTSEGAAVADLRLEESQCHQKS